MRPSLENQTLSLESRDSSTYIYLHKIWYKFQRVHKSIRIDNQIHFGLGEENKF